MHDDFEARLRASLQREDAPVDFAAKLMAKARAERVVPIAWWQRRGPIAAIAAAVILAVAVPEGFREYERRQTAERARDQLVLALQITQAKLDYTRQKIQRKK